VKREVFKTFAAAKVQLFSELHKNKLHFFVFFFSRSCAAHRSVIARWQEQKKSGNRFIGLPLLLS
jgi:hypothetical protein